MEDKKTEEVEKKKEVDRGVHCTCSRIIIFSFLTEKQSFKTI